MGKDKCRNNWLGQIQLHKIVPSLAGRDVDMGGAAGAKRQIGIRKTERGERERERGE